MALLSMLVWHVSLYKGLFRKMLFLVVGWKTYGFLKNFLKIFGVYCCVKCIGILFTMMCGHIVLGLFVDSTI